MDEVKQTEQKEHPFIRETIVNKKRGKIKRFLLLCCGAVVLATIFGVVSRFCFIVSEPFVNNMLGISPNPVPTQPLRNEVTLPQPQENISPTQTAQQPDNLNPEEQNQQKNDDTVDIGRPDDAVSEDVTQADGRPGETQNKEPEHGDAAGISEYMALHQEIRRIATNAASAMATVTVTTERTDWFEQVYEEETIVSGVIVGDNNVELLILTEASPLLSADEVKVTVGGYTTEDTMLYMSDSHYNLAVIGIDYASIPAQNLELINYAVFGESHSLFVGTPVIAIGNPNGYAGSFELGTVTARNSYAYVVDNRLDLFNTSISDYENGSGVIINTSGEVIGLITHTFKDGINQSLNTVIGISRMKPVIEQLVNGRKMNYFGVIAEELTEELREEADSRIGICVTEVIAGSPAEQAGIRKGDILQIIERTPMNNVLTLRTLLDEYEEGDEMTVTMLRKGPRAYTGVETVVVVGEKNLPKYDWQ